MAKTGHGNTPTSGTATFQLGFIKTYSPSYLFAAVVTFVEIVKHIRIKISFSSIKSLPQVHLHNFGHVVRIAKKSGMTAYSAEHGRSLVVDVPMDFLVSENIVLFSWGNIFLWEL